MDAEAVKLLLDAVRSGVGVVKFGDEHGIALVPDGFSIKDLQPVLPPPNRPKQRVLTLTSESFIDYIKKFGDAYSVVFAKELEAAYECVLDYHPGDGARGQCDHVVRYICEKSAEWNTWGGSDDTDFNQAGFARFIEANLVDIVRPTGAEMLQLALSLQVRKDANFVSDLRLETGQVQLRYEEQIRGTTKTGDMVIPDTFLLSIPVFTGGPRYNLEARLRYRIDKGVLTIGYELIRADKVLRQAIQETTDVIAQGVLGTTDQVYRGGRA